jgi:type II secretion system protein I
MILQTGTSDPAVPRRTYPGVPARRAKRGFTLIEVLVALVILSTGIVLVLRAFETALVASGRGRDSLVATALLRDKLIQVETALRLDRNFEPGGTETFAEGEKKGFTLRCSVNAAGSLRPDCGALYEVLVEVAKTSSGTDQSAATYVFVPPRPEATGKGLP